MKYFKFIKNNKTIFITTSSKSGSNTVLNLFLPEKGIATSDKNPISIHYKAKKYQINKIPENSNENFIKFKFVRNPYKRIVSAFLHLNNVNLSFYEFLIEVKKFLNNQNQNNNLLKTQVLQLSHMYILQKDNIDYDYISKIENLDNDIIKINQMYKLDLKYDNKKLNTRNTKSIVEKKIDYIRDKLKKYRSNIPDDYSFFYNMEIKQLVYDIYKIDIDYFNYDIHFI